MAQMNCWQSTNARIEVYPQGLDVAALRKFVLEGSRRDNALREKMLMAATVKDTNGISSLRKVVKQVTGANGFIEWRAAADDANRLEHLEELLVQRIRDDTSELVVVIEEAI